MPDKKPDAPPQLCGSSLAFANCRYRGEVRENNEHVCAAPANLHHACEYKLIRFHFPR